MSESKGENDTVEGVSATSETVSPLKKVIIVGDGGLGKTSLMNAISGSAFLTGNGEKDVTEDHQIHVVGDCMMIDTPGASLNLEKWWSDLHGVGKVNGVILIVMRQMRASAYGVFYYVVKYLESNRLPYKLYWAGEMENFSEPSNFLYHGIHRSALKTPEGLRDIRA